MNSEADRASSAGAGEAEVSELPVRARIPNAAATMDPQLVGNVGLYYFCYRLSLLGWNVMPTARNARGVDIIACSRDASRFVGVQVKAFSRCNHVPLGGSTDKIMGDLGGRVQGRVVTERLCADTTGGAGAARRNEKDGRASFWLQPIDYEHEQFRDGCSRIGHGGAMRVSARLPLH